MSTISGNLAAGGAFSGIAFNDIAFNDIGFGGAAFSENAFSENGFGDGMRDASMPGRGMIDTDMTERLSQFLDVDVARYKLISSNLANIDTPGYRTRDLDFRAELRHAAARSFENGGESSAGSLSYAAYAPMVRPVRGLMERPDGNNVSVERESLLLAESQMKYNLGVQLLKDEFHTISQAINSGGASS
ncbi:MAG: flagellar basal body rod protein FlgB [Candidatus Sulfotelmatobacter sp.]